MNYPLPLSSLSCASLRTLSALLMAAILAGTSLEAQFYTVTDLGSLLPSFSGSSSNGMGINSSGQVTGSTTFGQVQFVSEGFRAYRYSAGIMTPLGTTAGATGSYGYGINATGQVTGFSTTAVVGPDHAFLYDGSVMKDLGTLGGSTSYGYGINASGWVTGGSDTTASGQQHAFLYNGTGMVDLGTMKTDWSGNADPSGFSAGYGINDNGWVTGWTEVAPGGYSEAFLYNGTTMTSLGTFSGGTTGSGGAGINNSGQVTGWASMDKGGSQVSHAFRYSNGTMKNLGSLGGSFSGGLGINAGGQIVGQADTLDGYYRAFFYSDDTGMIDLNSLIAPGSGWVLNSANGINDLGQIVGTGTITGISDKSGNIINVQHGFLLTPVTSSVPDSGATAAMLGIVLAGLVALRRRLPFGQLVGNT
jgi:probable HAF family extracellular repeat protein